MSLGIGSIVALPEPAHAAIDCAAAPDDLAALQAAIPAGGAAAVGLGPGFPATVHTTQLAVPVGTDLTLDLCGRTLDLAPTIDGHAALSVPAGASLTILDSGGSGVLRATGATGPAVTGAGAGIGGNGLTSSGHIRIHAGTVIATGGGASGAGIGGGGGHFVGRGAGTGTVTITGGVITATADAAAAIGGGGYGDNNVAGGPGSGFVTISGGEVTATSTRYGAAIGGGRTGTGIVQITGGHIVATGQLLNAPGLGSGVNGRGGEVVITGGHVTAAGAGGAVGVDSPPADSAPQLLRISGGVLNAQALGSRPAIGGDAANRVSAEIVGVELNGDPGPWVAGTPTGSDGVPATLTATGTGHAFTIDTSPTEMRIAFTTGLTLTSAPTTATAGETITVTASVLDHEGQPLADVSSRLTLTSSVATDIISGNTVTFPTASPHTITASFGGHTASFTVEVTGGLAATGVADPLPLALGGGLLLLLGGSLAVWAFRRRKTTGGTDGYPPFTPDP